MKKTEMGRALISRGKRGGAYRVVWRNLREGGQLEDPGVDGRIILKWICEKWDGGQDLIGSGLVQVAGCSEYGNEL
jgi:hypothetical protein